MVQLSQSDTAPTPRGLGASARASLLWGGGFTLLRDLAQFGVMLILVRLLTPADYGTAALAQAIIGLVAVVSFGTFSAHALQMRDPDEIDWQAHFTAAAAINVTLAALVLALAYALSFTTRYAEAALPLAALAVIFIIEIPGTLRHRMLEANHDWKRFRLLLIIGTFLGLRLWPARRHDGRRRVGVDRAGADARPSRSNRPAPHPALSPRLVLELGAMARDVPLRCRPHRCRARRPRSRAQRTGLAQQYLRSRHARHLRPRDRARDAGRRADWLGRDAVADAGHDARGSGQRAVSAARRPCVARRRVDDAACCSSSSAAPRTTRSRCSMARSGTAWRPCCL